MKKNTHAIEIMEEIGTGTCMLEDGTLPVEWQMSVLS